MHEKIQVKRYSMMDFNAKYTCIEIGFFKSSQQSIIQGNIREGRVFPGVENSPVISLSKVKMQISQGDIRLM